MYMTFIVIVVIIIAIVLIVIMRKGNLSFWKIVNLDTNEFYHFIKNDDAWLINNNDSAHELDGPFKLYIEELGGWVKIYGVVGKYEDSQKQYLDHFNKVKN